MYLTSLNGHQTRKTCKKHVKDSAPEYVITSDVTIYKNGFLKTKKPDSDCREICEIVVIEYSDVLRQLNRCINVYSIIHDKFTDFRFEYTFTNLISNFSR